MAGAFINGPITPPSLRVEQIYRLREPLVPDSGLPLVVIGLNRQVVFEESIGEYNGTTTVLEVAGLSTYSATLAELDPITYKDSDTGLVHTTPSLPNVIFRHTKFGDKTIPKKTSGVDGWTFNQSTGELTLDANLLFVYEIVTGVGDLSAGLMSAGTVVEPNAGYRYFDASSADFIGDNVEAGDVVVTSRGRFVVVSVINETRLLISDSQNSLVPFTTELSDVSFTIEKTVTDGGSVYISYVANRSDMANRMISVERDTVDDLFGEESILDPLGFYVRMALKNTNTTVLALQVESDDLAGHTTAMGVLSLSDVPYNLAPLTQDEDILNEYISHVNLMSTADKAKERRVIVNFPLVLFSTKVSKSSAFVDFGIGGSDSERNTADSVVVKVNPGQNNLHVLGVVQGDVFRDLTEGTSGEARIVSVTPASPAVDAEVTLQVATPNTLKLFGTYAERPLIPTAAQIVGARVDVSAGVPANGHTVVLVIDGVTHTFTSAAVPANALQFVTGDNDDFFDKVTAYFGDRLDITQPGGAGTYVLIREKLGGFLNTSAGVPISATGGQISILAPGGGALTNAGYMDYSGSGVKSTDTFVLDDDVTPTTFTFVNDQTTANGSLISANNYAVQIGGPIMSAANVRDRIIAAVNAAGLLLSATALSTSPQLLIRQNHTGVLGGSVISSVTSPLTMGADVPGTGATNGSPLTSWSVTTKTLTVDEQATYVAQKTRDINNRRVMNVWPDICDERFEDLSAGTQLQQQGYGLFEGRTVIMLNQPNYGGGVMLMAARSNLLASDPLTKRPLIGPYDLHRIDDYFTAVQLERILSTGTMLLEQLQGAGGTIQVVRGVTTDTTDLKVGEENVGAAVDKFTRLVRQVTRPLFGPNVIDPDGNFFALLSTKVQAVINRMTRRETREARNILIVRVFENPDRKDSVIMEVVFEPLFGANDGILRIFI